MIAQLYLLLIITLLHLFTVNSQRVQTCSGNNLRFPTPSLGRCISSFANSRLETKSYPDDFNPILNQVQIYKCMTSNKRIIISNGIPNHDVTLQNRIAPCEVNWSIEIPLNPSVANEKTEIPMRGMVAMALNGVPAYGPQEADSNNAVEGTMGVPGARYWYGHAGPNSAWHVHNPKMGKELESHETLLGYAMDGVPIYGHLEDDSMLDVCNGMYKDGKYQYHVKTLDQVNDALEYCNEDDPNVNNWNYILGCYSGSVDDTNVYDSTTYELPDDCVVDDLQVSKEGTAAASTSTKKYVRIKSIDNVANGTGALQFECKVAGRGNHAPLVVDWVFIDVNDATVEKEEDDEEEEPKQKEKLFKSQWSEEEEEEIGLGHQKFGDDWQKIYDNSSILQKRYANSGVADVTRLIKRRYNSHIKNGKKKSGGGSKKKKAKDDDDDASFSPLSEGADEPLDVDDEEDDAASEYVDGRAAKRDNHSSRAAKRTKRIHNQKPPPTRRDNNNSTTPSEEKRPSIISNSIIGMPQNSNGISSMGSSLVSRLSSDNRPTIMGSGGTSNGNSYNQMSRNGTSTSVGSINQSSNNSQELQIGSSQPNGSGTSNGNATQLLNSLLSRLQSLVSNNDGSNSTEPKITPPHNPENFKYLPIPVGTESSDGRTIDKESYYNFETNQIETERPSFSEIRKKLPVAAVQQQSTAVPQIMSQQQPMMMMMPQQQMAAQPYGSQPQQYALTMMQQPVQPQYGMQMMPQQPMAVIQPQYGMQQPMMMMPQQPMMQQPMMQQPMMPLQQQQAPNRRDDGWCCIQ